MKVKMVREVLRTMNEVKQVFKSEDDKYLLVSVHGDFRRKQTYVSALKSENEWDYDKLLVRQEGDFPEYAMKLAGYEV